MPRYTKEQKEEMVRQYVFLELGSSTIASRFGCSDAVVTSAVRNAGYKIRPLKGQPKPDSVRKQWTDQERHDICELFQLGWSKRKLAATYRTSEGSINNLLLAQGIDPSDSRYPKGIDHHNWTGGRRIDGQGYIRVRVSDEIREWLPKGYSSPYAPEHRIVMAKHLGRPLKQTESVHHLNGDRQDNSIDNLQIRQGSHGPGQIWYCRSCGSNDIEARPIT